MKITSKTMITIGQEAICPDGLGRISKVECSICNTIIITVETYINNRSCCWDSSNIELVKIKKEK